MNGSQLRFALKCLNAFHERFFPPKIFSQKQKLDFTESFVVL